MKKNLWIDDVRPAPEGYIWIRTVSAAIAICIEESYFSSGKMCLYLGDVSLDHDAGDMRSFGGDYIRFLEWLEEKQQAEGWKIDAKFHIHSMNPVGRENMMRIIKKNGWSFY